MGARSSADDRLEYPPRRRSEKPRERVVDPDTPLRGLDQAGVLELRHVVGDCRLRQLERRCEVADADRLFGPPERGDHAESGRISQRLQEFRCLLELSSVGADLNSAADAALSDRELFDRHAARISELLTIVYRLP